jgi:hypothetical protein
MAMAIYAEGMEGRFFGFSVAEDVSECKGLVHVKVIAYLLEPPPE